MIVDSYSRINSLFQLTALTLQAHPFIKILEMRTADSVPSTVLPMYNMKGQVGKYIDRPTVVS